MVLIGALFSYYLTPLVVLCLSPLLVWAALSPWRQPRALLNSAQTPDWVPNFQGGPDRFYALVYERLQSDLTENQLPFNRLSFGPRSLFAKRHIFSARCVYLQVRYQEFSYYIYAVPAPGGLRVSSWLFSRHEAWLEHPLLKWLVLWRWAQMTLFQYDIMCLFHSVVDGALEGVINDLRQEQGLRPLEAYERRPVLRGFYAAMQTGAPIGRGGGAGSSSTGGNYADRAYIGGAYEDSGMLPLARQAVHQERPEAPLIQEPLIQQPTGQHSLDQHSLDQAPLSQQSLVGNSVVSSEEAGSATIANASATHSSGVGSLAAPRLPLTRRTPHRAQSEVPKENEWHENESPENKSPEDKSPDSHETGPQKEAR